MMTVPGADCPECDARLTADGCPKCGWMPAVAPSLCCEECRAPHRALALTLGDDRRRRCAGCHVAFLRTRAAAPGDPEVERCKTEFRRLMDRAAVRWATTR